mmetsp:Transcript_29333/g.74416  ORF Transcript_29333/g.74416 Transcript_29333/m.74416 type:complete len:92 (+) Transcript_29333:3-278(+)
MSCMWETKTCCDFLVEDPERRGGFGRRLSGFVDDYCYPKPKRRPFMLRVLLPYCGVGLVAVLVFRQRLIVICLQLRNWNWQRCSVSEEHIA